ncbi:protein transport protein Sec31A [Fopius arisanus]|uniref:Protein transport protein Sec31A n=1 Tax=Fopius arisanus TaxID=64838 RepID=A0A9R1T448_9HYME|nr:PREDICTED: protein transport protein Sec31A [Fopius arisanus]
MKVKELLKTVNVAWSPPAQHPLMLAAGTAAQQLDASFNTSASLDLYLLGLQTPGYDMELRASVPSDHRFHKIIWGSYGPSPSGIIVGGCDYGTIKIYSASKLLSNDQDCLLSSPNRHTGPVRALDFNPFQSNLLASGATESEIYIWDIVNTSTPMSPGSPSNPPEDIQYIQWNKQVQHILASAFTQRCIIWDLRKNEAIIKLSDANSKIRWKTLQWHPEMATQLCLASEDDQTPIIQLWDLRFASSPLRTFQHHQRGVLSIAWSTHDPDLLLSCAKDNTILCWNPNSDNPGGEVLCELAQTAQWNFDVSWCPRTPGLIVGSSFDGHAVVYSLLGGSQGQSHETANQIVDSFPGMDPFVQAPPSAKSESAPALKRAPKWLRRPAGVSFGFGGKLTIFENEPADSNSGTSAKRSVIVSQVITNPDMIKRSNELESALKTEQFLDYCQGKIENIEDEHLKKIWKYVGAYFSEDVTQKFLELLGYNVAEINHKLKRFIPEEDVDRVTDGVARAQLDSLQNGNFDPTAAFDAIAQQELKRSPVKIKDTSLKLNTSDDEDGLITQAILVGNIEAAVSLCFDSKRYADAVILSMAGGPDLLARTQYRYFSEHTGVLNSLINFVVSDNWGEIVENCDVSCWKETLVGIFTHSNAEERSALCEALGDRLCSIDDVELRRQAQICYICSGNLSKVIQVGGTGVQDTVELVMVLKRALELHGSSNVKVDGHIGRVLSQYAELLASEGDLDAALGYLKSGEEGGMGMLRDRLCKALQYVQTGGQQQPQQSQGQVHPQSYSQKSQQSIYGGGNVQSNYGQNQHAWNANNWNVNPMQNAWGMAQVVPPVQTAQPMPSQPLQSLQQPPKNYGQPQTILSPAAPPTAPPPMQTAGSSHSGSRPSSVGPSSRPKYMIDPSVKSPSSYGGYGQGYSAQNQVFGYQGQGYGEVDGFKAQPSLMTPSLPAQPPQGIYDPTMGQGGQAGLFAGASEPSAYQPTPQPAGWNDPPIAKFRNQQQANEFSAQNPILQPLRGAAPQQSYNAPEENYHQDPHNPYGQAQYNQTILNPSNQFSPPMGFDQHNQSSNTHQQQQHHPPVQAAKAAEPEIPKAPIPEEHLHLKTVLDELRIHCYESAKNPQTKRKVEDVARKLETLYDCLRDKSLSPNTLQGLHQICQFIQGGNYTNGLSIHTQLVSGPDFSRIAPFMPGIKVLLQSALQLGVYIT